MDAICAGISAVVSGPGPTRLCMACRSISLHTHVSETRFAQSGLDRFIAHNALKEAKRYLCAVAFALPYCKYCHWLSCPLLTQSDLIGIGGTPGTAVSACGREPCMMLSSRRSLLPLS